MIDFEWDEAKRALNRSLHKFDFADIHEFEWDTAFVLHDNRQDYGEERYIAKGKYLGRLTVVVFTRRGNNIRIISWRKANDREKKLYESYTQDRS